MTKSEIKETIEATKIAISTKIGERAKYSTELKKAILDAANAIGPSHFSRESGLDRSLISQWKRPSNRGEKETKSGRYKARVAQCGKKRNGIEGVKSANVGQPQNQSRLPNARELMITQDSVQVSARYGIIRSGDKLEIHVPLELLTPEWISKVVGGLNSGKGVLHA